jgi:hypothetical protein
MVSEKKNLTDRVREMTSIYTKLADLGLSTETCPSLEEFKRIANTFVKDGVGQSGVIKIPEIQRELQYKFSMQSHIDSSIILRSMDKHNIQKYQ